jgi:hypothetical protein
MQAVSLVTGDEFLLPYNLTIDANDVLHYIKKLSFVWKDFANHMIFDDQYAVELAEIVGPTGFCQNFNLILAADLFNLEHLPETFNYSKKLYSRDLVMKYIAMAKVPKDPYPMRVIDSRSGFHAMTTQSRMYRDPLEVNHHEKYNFQGFKYLIHSPFEMISATTTLHQSIVNHSMIIYLNPQKTIIHKTLRSYGAKRFHLKLFRQLNKLLFQTWLLSRKRNEFEVLQKIQQGQLQI